jgi:predicted RNA binding protein YcfA (HicA-like mRNA interferase family)
LITSENVYLWTAAVNHEAVMAKPSELHAALQTNPSQIIAFRDFERLLVAYGFVLKRIRGSHRAYKHPVVPELLTIQPRGKDARPYQVRRFLDMTERFGLEVNE